MIHEHARVVLPALLADECLEAGGIGTVVHVDPRYEAYEVEFVTLTGKTSEVVTLSADQISPVGNSKIPHARESDRH